MKNSKVKDLLNKFEGASSVGKFHAPNGKEYIVDSISTMDRKDILDDPDTPKSVKDGMKTGKMVGPLSVAKKIHYGIVSERGIVKNVMGGDEIRLEYGLIIHKVDDDEIQIFSCYPFN